VGWNKIELSGRVVREPELRTAPNGQLLLRFPVDCGKTGRKLELEVLVLGERGRELKGRLKTGHCVKISGRLKAAQRGSNVGLQEMHLNVIATEVVLELLECKADAYRQTERARHRQGG
jgi:primosomal replication protein N